MSPIGRSLHNLWTIFKHEFSLYFISPIIYFVGAVWLGFAGLFFMNSLLQFNSGYYEPSMSGTLYPMSFLMMFFAPAFTMRLLAEEVHSGTHELLFTAPIRDWEVVVGKWLGVWSVITILILITLLFPALLLWRGSPDPGLIASGYLGFWLWCGAILAIGVLTSSLTQYQLVALLVGEGIGLLLFLMNIVTGLLGGLISGSFWSDVLGQLTLTTHLQSTMLSRGLVDPVDVVYFLGMMAISLFLATQILSARRWRA